MNKRLKNIVNTAEEIKTNDQKINDIYERCLNNETMSAFELVNSLGIALKLLEEGTKSLGFLADQIHANTKNIDNLEILKHIGIAALISTPIVWLATLKQSDFYVTVFFSGTDLLISLTAIKLYFDKIETHKKIIEELDNDLMNSVVPRFLKKCEECIQIVLNRIESMEDTNNFRDESSFVHNFANSVLVDAFGTNDLTICLSLPDEFKQEVVNILQKDLNSEETDLKVLFEMAKSNLTCNPFDDPQILSRIK